MKLKNILAASLIIFLLSSYTAQAQTQNKYKRRKNTNRIISHYVGIAQGVFKPYYSVAFNVNALNYFGDLAPVSRIGSTDVSFTRPGFGGSMEYRFKPNWAFRTGFSWGRIKGDDFTSDPNDSKSGPRYERNLSFRNDIKELKVGMTYYLSRMQGGVTSRSIIDGYIFAGLGVFHHNPKGKVPLYDYQANNTTNELQQSGEWVSLRALGTEGQYVAGTSINPYSQFQLTIPVAVGVRMALPGPFDVGLEFGYRFLFTDYIDDVSGTYVELDSFEDPLARIMSDRSTEPIAVWDGLPRAQDLNLVDVTFPNTGEVYKINQSNGTGREGSIRGNPDNNDMIFVTTLRFTYLIYPRNALNSKIR